MKAVLIHRYGGNDVLALEDVPEPALRPRDVLIDVHAASVNPIDFKIRGGGLKAVRKLAFPIRLGFDVSGIVRQRGPAATRFAPGAEVFASLDERMGGFAECVAADESVVAAKPKKLDHEHAAALPLVSLTSWQALVDIAKVGPGSKVLIHAGAGGIGTAAIQIAKHLGATVATTTSTKNVAFVRSLGADTVIDYTQADFTQTVAGQDVVFETLGGASELRSLAVIRRGGIMVSIAGLPDAAWAQANGLNPVMTAGLWLMTLRRTLEAKRRGVRLRYLMMRTDGEELARIAALADEGKLIPIIDSVLPLAQIKDAFARLEAGHARGKIIIKVR